MKPQIPQIRHTATPPTTNPNAQASGWISWGVSMGASALQRAYDVLPTLTGTTTPSLEEREVGKKPISYKDDLYSEMATMTPEEAFYLLELKMEENMDVSYLMLTTIINDEIKTDLEPFKEELNEALTKTLILLDAVKHLIEKNRDNPNFLKLVPDIMGMCEYNPIIYVQRTLSKCDPHISSRVTDFPEMLGLANITTKWILSFLKEYLASDDHLMILSKSYEDEAKLLEDQANLLLKKGKTDESENKARNAKFKKEYVNYRASSFLSFLENSEKDRPGRQGMAELLLFLIENTENPTWSSMNTKLSCLNQFIYPSTSQFKDLAETKLGNQAAQIVRKLFQKESNANNPDFLTLMLRKNLEEIGNPRLFREALNKTAQKTLDDINNKSPIEAIESFQTMLELLSATVVKTDHNMMNLSNELIKMSAKALLKFTEKNLDLDRPDMIKLLNIFNDLENLLITRECPPPELDEMYDLKLKLRIRSAEMLIRYTDGDEFKKLEPKEVKGILFNLRFIRGKIKDCLYYCGKLDPEKGMPLYLYPNNPNTELINSAFGLLSDRIEGLKK